MALVSCGCCRGRSIEAAVAAEISEQQQQHTKRNSNVNSSVIENCRYLP
jgi:hypothetical protein